MPREISEPDWKLFRQLRTIALERFCERALTDLDSLASESGKTAHDRYLNVFELLQRRDRELSDAFDAARRSTAFFQLAAIRSRGLLTDEEFARFSPEARSVVQVMLGA